MVSGTRSLGCVSWSRGSCVFQNLCVLNRWGEGHDNHGIHGTLSRRVTSDFNSSVYVWNPGVEDHEIMNNEPLYLKFYLCSA